MRISFIIAYFFIVFSVNNYAQEVLTGLSGNPVAEEYYKNFISTKKDGPIDTLELPFIDDFSNSYVVPDQNKWSDKYAFINYTYPVSSVSVGVATLDALDYDGSHYINASSLPFVADHLTSKPINLAYNASDSIYLSFYYQPQGLGEMPDPQDSLCLDFFDPLEQNWTKVWAVPGSPLKPFQRVMINIKEEKYLKKGFQFRFRNYASLPEDENQFDRRANVDHWNLDYIILDKNRTISDTVLRDVAFIEPLSSILKDFNAIPWSHFPESYNTQRKPFVEVSYVNHDTITRNVTRSLVITDMNDFKVYSTVPTANDISPGDTARYNIPFDYPFNFLVGDSAEFKIQSILGTDAFDHKPNDTLLFYQNFFDYYAYDDGSAEAGYGLRGEGTKNASVAVKFNTFRPDSLRAVDIYFNKLPDSLNTNFYFYLNIWDNKLGEPGSLRYSQSGMRPVYTDSLNKFHRYKLDSAILVKDTFYIGWSQTVDKLINIGFDRNSPVSNRIFYNLGAKWVISGFKGSLMMRPVVSMSSIIYSVGPDSFSEHFLIYPNPARDFIIIELREQHMSQDNYISIYDFTGKLLLSELLTDKMQLDLRSLSNGIYLLMLENKTNRKQYRQKLLIQR